jgi:CpeS-like protein
MDIQDFFQQSAGRWFSQRTSHVLATQQSENGKSNIQIDHLEGSAPAVIQLCQQHSVDPSLALCGISIVSESSLDLSSRKTVTSTLLVPLANPQNPSEGKLLHQTSPGKPATGTGSYSIGSDDALTLITESDTLYTEERIWFASQNLRLRTSVLKLQDGFSLASFCTEIRLGVTQAPAPSDASASAS